MKQGFFSLNLLALSITSAIAAEEVPGITVESTRLSDVSGEEVKSADLADTLNKKLSGVSIVRRSGIANDIILRGQKKDNINILIDNAKIYGACPNRMDPPTSHILTNTIDSITVIQGPYDVENFGTLSGAIDITTRKPSENFEGEISLNMGSWDYRKYATTLSGGNDKARFLISASTESSAQYEDGDGNDFYQQIELLNLPAVQYKDIYRDIDAYEKKTFLGKLYLDITDDQQLNLSYTANRSDDILYPSSKMDALYDDSNLFNMEYSFKNLGTMSKSLDIHYYSSDVEHPMSTFYRNSSGANSENEVISMLTTDMQGIKIKNTFELSESADLTLGVDSSTRNWDGEYIGSGTSAMITGRTSIADVDTENNALFARLEKQYTSTTIKAGIRYDDTSITADTASGLPANDYSGLSANIMASFQATDSTNYFAGIGQSSRVPDARELYFQNSMGVLVGTPTLNETTNTEIDFGAEQKTERYTLRSRLFHSWLSDFIYFQDKGMPPLNSFVNLDATIYGLEVDGSYFINDEFYIDFGLTYLRGQKDEAISGQTDKDLAEIPPLKFNSAVNYEYSYNNLASLELIAADAWDKFDSDNGEQAIPGYAVINLKVTHNISNNFELTGGIDNLLDRRYAVTNTYKDLTLLSSGGDVILLNEPGQYYYLNATYKF